MSFARSFLKEELDKHCLSDVSDITDKMSSFMDMVLERNETINLTTIIDREEFVKKHLLDSIACYGWTEIENAKKIVDVGTGAGFPGIPLAICYPDKQFALLDSLNKRIDFINDVVAGLGLANVKAIHSRAEDAGRDAAMRESFDLCVTRAVAPLNILLEYCLPLVKTCGHLYAYKTIKALEEIKESSLALRLLGASTDVLARSYGKDAMTVDASSEEIVISPAAPYSLAIFVVDKIKNTPKEYPRKAGTPKKIPL